MSKLLRISFPSNTDYLRCIEAFFQNFMNINGLYKSLDANDVFLALIEGVVNAVKHGNRGDTHKNVTLTLSYEGDLLKIIVEDGGHGFDPDDVKDPTHPDNISVPGGRGIFLMRQLMDGVEYEFNDDGTRLIMVKNV